MYIYIYIHVYIYVIYILCLYLYIYIYYTDLSVHRLFKPLFTGGLGAGSFPWYLGLVGSTVVSRHASYLQDCFLISCLQAWKALGTLMKA